ncbi:MAG TPA: helix-turn-helix transcriptional regulator [Longimicrobiales bacterium]|nr:helix-turn-helix transcriptional regulator [Longimicrobiales bacterium]
MKATIRPVQLTPRQKEIAELIAHGKPVRDIAKHLGISKRTVETHIRAIHEKIPPFAPHPLRRITLWWWALHEPASAL